MHINVQYLHVMEQLRELVKSFTTTSYLTHINKLELERTMEGTKQ